MNKKDKDNLMIAMYFIVFIALVVSFVWLGKYIKPMYIGVATLILQQIYMIPRLNKLYLRLKNSEVNVFVRFCPLLNEISMFYQSFSKAVLAFTLLTLGFLGLTFINPYFVNKVIPGIAYNYTTYVLSATIVSYIILCIIRGVAYGKIFTDISNEMDEMYSIKGRDYWGWVTALSYLFFFVPVFRVFGILMAIDRANKLVIINKIHLAATADSTLVEED